MKLAVWTQEHRIGDLSYDGATGRFAFEYAPAWLEWDQRFALCPSLPLTQTPQETPEQHSAAVRQFFQNLLPEGQALDDAARVSNVSKANVLGLLHALGRETAGALVISLPDERPDRIEVSPRLLSDAELSERIRHRPSEPFTVWDGKVRLSIAGYQDKLAVYEHEGQWFLVEDPTLASTLILKPEPVRQQMAGMTTNELMCLRLAHALKLPAAKASLRHVPEPVLVIERFDRKLKEGRAGRMEVQRLHCIDGCQALGLPVDFKYERPYGDGEHVKNIRDGASLRRFFSLLSDKTKIPAPGVAQLEFLRWVIFQVLIGNTDAHAKNLSFFSSVRGLQLAPTYDLVSGLVFAGDGVLDSLAMAIGDNFDPVAISAYDWAQLAHENNLHPRLVAGEVKRLAQACKQALPTLMSELAEEGAEASMMTRVAAVIERQCEEALRVAPHITKIDAVLF
ncbi:type II toxin-antitoxin system HipA family toxin [Noviherbaspirillum cavernae]|uniref:Type II toxin-antitoxin system HipA family toxin n=1 Tax=Noviherbaspirillum cavernae TaxID=2320862 RepID=A0A418X0T4_9BURK|nr:HipA domain-containing protein [Noviherbaspirillum cavernae]RJG06079.1 type II toxin-antitoxin system HipA family toxin [Noviherbaspirillum cavernae]